MNAFRSNLKRWTFSPLNTSWQKSFSSTKWSWSGMDWWSLAGRFQANQTASASWQVPWHYSNKEDRWTKIRLKSQSSIPSPSRWNSFMALAMKSLMNGQTEYLLLSSDSLLKLKTPIESGSFSMDPLTLFGFKIWTQSWTTTKNYAWTQDRSSLWVDLWTLFLSLWTCKLRLQPQCLVAVWFTCSQKP